MKDCADHMHAQTTDQSAQRRIVGTAMLPVSTTRLFWGLLCEYGVLSRYWERRAERDSKSKRPGQAGKTGTSYHCPQLTHASV